MPAQAKCPKCGSLVPFPEEGAGTILSCASCGQSWDPEQPALPPPDAYRENPPVAPGPDDRIREAPGDVPAGKPPTRPGSLDDDDDDDEYYDRLDTHYERRRVRDQTTEAKNKLMGPAIGLFIGAVIGVLSGLYLMFSGGLVAAMMGIAPPPAGAGPGAGAARTINISVGAVYVAIGLARILLSAVSVAGGVQMLRLRSRKLAVAACIIAMIPCVDCCFVISMPFAIWGLVVLMDNRVKSVFTS